jgi:myotubularin-related protein 1/2
LLSRDRTAQICAITQILLDPYFRTIDGLAVLIEKDWCAFGHKFQERLGHGKDHNVLPDERSPVFLQFLDLIYQLMLQFPNSFEYNENLLLFLANHSTSCLFGNFLGNSDKERIVELLVQSSTQSIWAYVLHYQEQAFKNKSYQLYDLPIWPSVSMNKFKVWERFWMRWDLTSHPNNISGLESFQDDW